MTTLAVKSPVNPIAIKYINRLSDHLFVLARYLNGRGKARYPVAAGGQSVTGRSLTAL